MDSANGRNYREWYGRGAAEVRAWWKHYSENKL
jgi:hypothetical protein